MKNTRTLRLFSDGRALSVGFHASLEQFASALKGGERINTPTAIVHLRNILDLFRKSIGAHFKPAGEADMDRTLESFNILA
jgi:hypothetical protein